MRELRCSGMIVSMQGLVMQDVGLQLTSNYKTINVKNQMNDAESIYSYYKKLIQLRKNYPIIVYGDFHPLFMRKVRKITVIFANLEKKNYLYYAVFQKRNSLLNYQMNFWDVKV